MNRTENAVGLRGTPAGPASAPLAAPRAATSREVIESSQRAWLKYLGGMGLALLPFALLVNDAHWVNIIAFTYLMGGWRRRGTSSAASAASSRSATACSSASAPT